jgi:hypothetical protein
MRWQRKWLGAVGVASLLGTGVALAQSNSAASNLEGGGESGSQAQVAAVGAGTANGVTTGVSGPDQGGGVQPGELPPLPSADLCSDYEGEPAYEHCLGLVLVEEWGDEL